MGRDCIHCYEQYQSVGYFDMPTTEENKMNYVAQCDFTHHL
ncbi:hypothetical protein BLOT_000184 [Blomia tropicalis]|nr:hypothetical protein BLOT_000184 [Blomia tropicalis]